MMQFKNRLGARLLLWVCLLALTLPVALPAAPVLAQAGAPAAEPVSVTGNGGGVSIAFATAGVLGDVSAAAPSDLLPIERYQGYDLPIQVIPLRFPSAEAAAAALPQITRLETVDLPADALTPGALLEPPVILAEGENAPVAIESVALPQAPLFVLRSGWIGSDYVVVFALSPYYREGGQTKQATAIEAVVPGAQPIAGLASATEPDDALIEEVDANAVAQASADEVAGAFSALEAEAASTVVKLRVSQVGIQRIQRSTLGTAFADPNATFRLSYLNQVVPLQVTASELRFYAPVSQDRWNPSVVYLLTVNPQNPGPAVAARAAAAPAAGDVATVIERGVWEYNQIYESRTPGIDGDHYFAAALSTNAGPAEPSAPVTVTLASPAQIAPPNTLPLLSGPTTFSITVGHDPKDGVGEYPLDIVLVGSGGQRATRSLNVTPGVNPTTTRRFVEVGAFSTLYLRLMATSVRQSLFVEQVAYERPAQLALRGTGALFAGRPGESSYRWSSSPALESTPIIWDISDPYAPVALSGVTRDGFADTQTGRTYIVSGAGFSHTPTVEAYKPYRIDNLAAAHALYITPSSDFATVLSPLVALRQRQTCRGTEKCRVLILNVQSIYDGFGAGNVNPDAIRRFLQQYYAAKSSPRLISTVLVGDGSYDPHNYEKKETSLNLIPPYLRNGIDPWMSEAACDRCYGQLTGDDPHTGDGALFVPEITIGRFPVNTRAQLVDVVAKIVRYETGSGGTRSSVFFFADNFVKKTNSGPLLDTAGDFAAESDEARALYPGVSWPFTPRVYYDPYPERMTFVVKGVTVHKPSHRQEPWREADPATVNARTIAGLNAGPAVAVYNGHANHFNMGSTESEGPNSVPAILRLNDHVALTNSNQLYVQLSMTCQTAQFAKPTNAGQVVDERMFIHATGGAVAVWGSTGLSVVQGHARLQEGFFAKLYAANGRAERLDKLMEEGFLHVALYSTGEMDILRTFVLFGDPLTRLRFVPGNGTFLPIVTNPQ